MRDNDGDKCVTAPLQNGDSLSMWYRRDDPRRTSISRKPRRKNTQAVDALEEAMRQWTSWVKTLKSTRKAHCSRRIRGADGWLRSAVENELSEGRLSGPVERCCCSKCVVSLLKMCVIRCIVFDFGSVFIIPCMHESLTDTAQTSIL